MSMRNLCLLTSELTKLINSASINEYYYFHLYTYEERLLRLTINEQLSVNTIFLRQIKHTFLLHFSTLIHRLRSANSLNVKL